ncbi:MAG: hypothetical protein ABEJ36_06190 [Candidatus Nanosalina sp.]
MGNIPGKVESYQMPLMKVPSWEFDEYLSALETTIQDRLDEVPEPTLGYSEISYGLDSHRHRGDPWALDRSIYHEMLENLEDVDTKKDLFLYAEEIVETSEPRLPAPFNLLEKMTGSLVEYERGKVVEQVFEEAKQELAEAQSK